MIAKALALRPRTVPRTGDDSPAGSVAGYVRRMTGWHQGGIAALAVLTAALGFAPVELQRRIVDDAIDGGDAGLLATLGILYGAVLLAGQAAKGALMLYQGWLSESAARYTRGHLLRLHRARDGAGQARDGAAISVIGTEVDKLAGFAGEGLSGAVGNAALLAIGIGYMLSVDAAVAAVGLALLLPQALLAPILQRRLNRLMALRLRLMRGLGSRIAGEGPAAGGGMLDRIYANRMAVHAWKALTKGALNLANGLAPLSVLMVGGSLAIAGETTIGTVVAFVSGFQRLSDPLRALIGFYRNAAEAGVRHRLIARWM